MKTAKEIKVDKSKIKMKSDFKVWSLSFSLSGCSTVLTSAIHVLGEPETYIFPCNKSGEVTGWLELDGSFKGDLCHKTALGNAGYQIISNE